MRFRRHFGSGRVFDSRLAAARRLMRRGTGPAPGAPDSAQPAGAPRRAPLWGTMLGRRLVRDGIVILSVFAIGYVVASVWLSPVPLITTDHAVPRVLELTGGEALRRLEAVGFRVKFDEERQHPTIPRGNIVWQDPPPGLILPQNSVIVLSASAGRVQVPVPDVVGLPRAQAERVLAGAGLRVGAVDTVAADPEDGIVVATRPSAGAARDPGTAIGLVVSGRSAAAPLATPASNMVPLGSAPGPK
jgi:hypothetical protein